MEPLDFFEALRHAVEQESRDLAPQQIQVNDAFLMELKNLTEDNATEPLLNKTRCLILFEGFYSSLTESVFKGLLAQVRMRRWLHHFGTPTLTFLLTYRFQINNTQKIFDTFVQEKRSQVSHLSSKCTLPAQAGIHSQAGSVVSAKIVSLLRGNDTVGCALKRPDTSPWIVAKEAHFRADKLNQVLVDPESIFQIEAPQQKEAAGLFIKTYNPLGGCTTEASDLISQRFIEHASAVGTNGGLVLEIGAAFGTASLPALAKGANLFCNDIDARNLAVVRQRYLESKSLFESVSVTGDESKLTLLPGALPDELYGLPPRSFDAILISRVLHFFTGKKIEESLNLVSMLLKPNGKIYIVCETPFLKNWDLFIPELDKRIKQGIEWPGEIMNTDEFDRSGRASSSSRFINWITKEVLERSLLKAGLTVEHAEYINRAGQFPEDLLRPEMGKESVGAVGQKIRH